MRWPEEALSHSLCEQYCLLLYVKASSARFLTFCQRYRYSHSRQKLALWIFVDNCRQLVCVDVYGGCYCLGRTPERPLWNVSQFLSASGQGDNDRGGAFFRDYCMQLMLPGIPTRTGGRNVRETSMNALQGAPRAVTPRPHAPLEVMYDHCNIGLRMV